MSKRKRALKISQMEHEKYFKYFDRAVLNYYRTNSHVYELTEDDMGGEIRISSQWNEDFEKDFPYIELKFAFRKLKDKRICLGVFMPSFKDKVSEKDYSKWLGFLIESPTFHEHTQEFDRWVERYINGSWEVDDGPKIQIERELKYINALTQIEFEQKFFKHHSHCLLNYPIAENSEEYTKAILEAYRLLIDGMSKDVLINIAKKLNVGLKDQSKRLNSFKEIIPIELLAIIYNPFDSIYNKRMPIHGIPSKGIIAFPAFDTFNEDLKKLNIALKNLRIWLEDIFNKTAESCLSRLESLTLFPEIVALPRPEFKLAHAQKMIGKQIEKVEFGGIMEHADVHLSEALNIYFTDGTAVTLQIGSNAYNIHSKYEHIKPSDFHTDMMIFWASSINKRNNAR